MTEIIKDWSRRMVEEADRLGKLEELSKELEKFRIAIDHWLQRAALGKRGGKP